MDGRQGGGKKDPAVASTFEAGDGEVSGLEPAGQAGVDFSGLGSAGVGSGDLHPDVNDLRSESSSHRLARPSRGEEHVGDADPAAPVFARAGRGGADPLVRERELVHDNDMAADYFPRAAGDMILPAALLAMQVGALTLISDLDAPWPDQLGAFLIWLAGCVALFLSRH